MVDRKPGVVGASAALNRYWTRGEGLAKWATSPHPWTTLRALLLEYVPANQANGLATEYYHIVFGDYPGSDTARVRQGRKPRGDRIGPG